MITIVYPLFERGRILKKESLLALRDYSFGLAQLQFSDHTDGILSGCAIMVSESQITVSPGMFKFRDFIYVMKTPQTVSYEATEQTQLLKIQFLKATESETDYLQYAGKLTLNHVTVLQDNEIELCRFKLKIGSRLRCDYTDFADIQTEFDTINLAHATWSGVMRPGIAAPILTQFARQALSYGLQSAWDITFCAQCLQHDRPSPHVIDAYLVAHGQPKALDSFALFHALLRILETLSGVPQTGLQHKNKKRQIMVD